MERVSVHGRAASRRWAAPLLAWIVALFAVILPVRPLWAYAPPPMTGAVTDPGGKLSAAERKALGRKLAAYYGCSHHQIAVLVATSLQGESIEDAAYTTFNTWKLGRAGQDDGVLLLVAPAERKVRIEVGKGLDGVLPDLMANDILREHVSPHMKQGEIFRALDEGTSAIGRAVGGCAMIPAIVAPAPPPSAAPSSPHPAPSSPHPAPSSRRPATAAPTWGLRPAPSPAPLAWMALVVGALLAGVIKGRRGGAVVAALGGVVGAFMFAVWTLMGATGPHGFDPDAALGWFAVAALVLGIANVIAWGMRRYEPRRSEGWVTPPGGGGAGGDAPTPRFDPWPSTPSSFDGPSGSSSSDPGGFTGGGGSSGGAGSSDSY